MSEHRRGAGRPPFPGGTAKTRMFAIRMTSSEHAAIEAAASRVGKPVTQWARERLLAAVEVPPRDGVAC